MDDMRTIGSGTNVMKFEDKIEGVVKFLDSPQEVLEFISGDEVEETIVISRGGATTFMSPALTAGVRGLITLQGMPESHLGILSREFGVPCVMSVTFTDGIKTDRGEIIPADGTTVALDLSDAKVGHVQVSEGGK